MLVVARLSAGAREGEEVNRFLIAAGALLVLADVLWPLNTNHESLFASAGVMFTLNLLSHRR